MRPGTIPYVRAQMAKRLRQSCVRMETVSSQARAAYGAWPGMTPEQKDEAMRSVLRAVSEIAETNARLIRYALGDAYREEPED